MYKNNEDYFKTWSQNMAYILGFAISDGCIDDKNGHNMLCWNVQKQDVCVLEFIRNEISPTRHICYRKSAPNIAFLGITSKTIVKDLARLCVVPNKTGREQLPNIPTEYRHHFLRGLFDGDGNISYCERIRKSGKRAGSLRRDFEYRIFCLSKPFLESVKSILCFDYGNISWTGTCYALRISKKAQLEKIIDFMYHDADFYLTRKKLIADMIPKPKKYFAFGEYKSIPDWLLDPRCIVTKTLIKTRLQYTDNFEYIISTPKIKDSGNHNEHI